VKQTANLRKLTRTLSLLLCIASLLLIMFLGHAYITNADQMLGRASDNAENQAECAVEKISNELGELPAITKSIADDISTGRLEDGQVAGRLKDTLEEHPELFGIAAGYVPYEYNPKNASANAENPTEYAVREVGSTPGELPAVTEQIADDISTGRLEDGQVAGRLNGTLEEHPELFGIAAGYVPYEYNPNTSNNAENPTEYAVREVGSTPGELPAVTEQIADDISTGKLENDWVDRRLNGTLEEYPKTRLYAPYYIWAWGAPRLIQIENLYDYTLPDVKDGTGPRTAWYYQPIDEGAGWIDPYFGRASDTVLAVYARPFYRADESGGEGTPAGAIAAVYSLDDVRDLVGSLDLGDAGYGFIITEEGTVVAHPIREYLGRDIKELQETDETLRLISRDMNPGEHQKICVNHTGRTLWVFYEQIPSSNWTLGAVFVEDTILESIKTSQRHLLIHIALAVMAFLFFLSILIFRVDKDSSSSLWAVVIVFSILCALGTGFIWYLALEDSSDGGSHSIDVFDKVGLEVAMHKLLQDPEVKQSTDQPTRIPTGIFLQSLRFSSANNVIVTGYVWQDHSDNKTANVSHEVIFPEAEEVKIEEAYDLDNGVTGWYFRAVLRQQFDYSKYPLDREDVWIRLWPGEFYRNVILTPDFDSYSEMHPDRKPGLEQDFVLEGCEIENSYFSYRKNSYTTTFGVDNPSGHDKSPELYYNVGMRRNFMTPLVANLTPLVVVALLLFAVLMILTHDTTKISLYGFNASAVLAYCAALFFVLIVSHVAIRQKLAANGIIYLEYFYFVLYLAILTTSVNSILFASNTRSDFIHYRDNLVAKLLYWPLILGITFGITLMVFY